MSISAHSSVHNILFRIAIIQGSVINYILYENDQYDVMYIGFVPYIETDKCVRVCVRRDNVPSSFQGLQY